MPESNNGQGNPGDRTESVDDESGPWTVDREEAVATAAVKAKRLTPEQGHAALVVSRLTNSPVAEVLKENRVVGSRTASNLEEQVDEHLIPGYRILERVGRGSQGIVYKAIQKCLDRVVALKVVTLRTATRDSLQRRLEREARAIARVSHPNIVTAYDYGESRGRMFLAMEFVDGISCDEELERRPNAYRWDRALAIVRESALGLGCALEAGIVHRDIKPGNLLLPTRRDGDNSEPRLPIVKVTDLGLSRMGDSDLTVEGTILGTPGYMAPEQARGEPVDHRADIYALGATLYHMATGRRPFASPEAYTVLVRQASERLPDPRDTDPEIPSGVAYLLQGMMSRERATRYGCYRDLVEDIDRVASGGKPVFPMPPSRDRSLRGPGQGSDPDSPTCMDTGSRILVLDRRGSALVRILELKKPGYRGA
jgi:serine/threonine-protein kinase